MTLGKNLFLGGYGFNATEYVSDCGMKRCIPIPNEDIMMFDKSSQTWTTVAKGLLENIMSTFNMDSVSYSLLQNYCSKYQRTESNIDIMETVDQEEFFNMIDDDNFLEQGFF